MFGKPNLKKGVNFGKTVSIYEKKSESAIKKVILFVKRDFLRFLNFFLLPFYNKSLQRKLGTKIH